MSKKHKRVLMVVLEFPPGHSAGVQRPLKFAEYLPESGWEPIVLTAKPDVYDRLDASQHVPHSLRHLYRTKALNARRDFATKGRYLSWTAQPDPFWSWAFTAIPMGRRLIEALSPAAIWSTYPATISHYIACWLSRRSGLPWIADFRDPFLMRQRSMPKLHRKLAGGIERKTMEFCSRAVFTTERAKKLYQSLYPHKPETQFAVVPNGFDEAIYTNIKPARERRQSGVFQLLHSGALYAGSRDPLPVFLAVADLARKGIVEHLKFELVFRGASGTQEQLLELRRLGIARLVRFESAVGFRESIAEMMGADGLLLLQGARFQNQVPGKAYEYIRAGKPILAVTPSDSATAESLREIPGVYFGQEVGSIALAIESMLKNPDAPTRNTGDYSRRARTADLVGHLEQL